MLRNKFQLNISHKLFLYLLLACLLPITIFGIASTYKAKEIYKSEIDAYSRELIRNKFQYMDLMMHNVESLIQNLSSVEDIRNTLMTENSNDYYRLNAQAKIGYILSGYTNLGGLVSIDIFSVSGAHYHVGDTLNFSDTNKDLLDKIFKIAIKSNNKIVWNGIEDNVNKDSKYKKVITASKTINILNDSTLEEKTIGLIVVNYAIDSFTKNITSNNYDNLKYIVIDGENRILCYPDGKNIGEYLDESIARNMEGNIGSFVDNISNGEKLVYYIRSEISNWTIMAMISGKYINAKTWQINIIIMLLVVFFFLMSILFAFLISRIYLSPVKKITESFKQIKNGNIDAGVRLKVKSRDEIGDLTVWFNAFLENLHEMLYREKLLKGITDSANILLSVTEYDQSFENALRILGELVKADSVLFAERQIDQLTGDFIEIPRFEWSRDGNKNNSFTYYNNSLETTSHKHDMLASGNTICGLTRNIPEPEKSKLEKLGILSVLLIPIFLDNTYIGYIGFNDRKNERIWSKVEKDMLKAAALNIGGAFKRIRTEQTVRNMLKDDFRKTVQNLQNLIFKVKKDAQGSSVFTLFEGKKAHELGFDTNAVFGKKTEEFLPEDLAYQFNSAFTQAFKGEMVRFEFLKDGWNAYSILSPVLEDGVVTEVVGSVFDITDLKNAEERIKYLAYYDALTGLPNRTLCIERLREAISDKRKRGDLVAILFMDLDQFKLINDSLGHAVGDNLLKEAANRLKNCTRETDTVCRMGGDEFVLIYPMIKSIWNVETIAHKILDEFRKPFKLEEHELFITTSIGISMYPADGIILEELIKNADMAMYKAKESGRNNYQFFTSEMNKHANDRLKMENDLRKAIEQEEFFLVYQPKVDTFTGKITGVEALIRWQHPVLGLVSPGTFIPLAEESGMIHLIGEWVINRACAEIRQLHDLGYDSLCVSVNISAKQFQQNNVVEIVKRALLASGLEPSFLELEITENCIITNTEKTIMLINEFYESGIKISIDDFGKGFSSMAYLKRFSVDKLKIDQSFISDIEKNNSDSSISLALINIAHSLGLKAIAEGVETEAQLNILKQYNCDEVQGYLFSKPLNFRALREFLAEGNI